MVIDSQSGKGMKQPTPEFLTLGRVTAPWGIKGEVKVEVITEFPQRFSPMALVYIDGNPLTIDRSTWRRGKVILKFTTIDTIEEAQRLRGKSVEVPLNQVHPLPEEQYYHFQIIGLEAWTTQGELLGNIDDILSTAGNDIYVVHGSRGEILIPAVEDVVKSIDIDKRLITIEPIKGLF